MCPGPPRTNSCVSPESHLKKDSKQERQRRKERERGGKGRGGGRERRERGERKRRKERREGGKGRERERREGKERERKENKFSLSTPWHLVFQEVIIRCHLYAQLMLGIAEATKELEA